MVVINEVELKESSSSSKSANWKYISQPSKPQIPVNLEQQYFTGRLNINTNSMDRKLKSHKNKLRSYQRLSTFQPNSEHHEDLGCENIDDTTTVLSPRATSNSYNIR